MVDCECQFWNNLKLFWYSLKTSLYQAMWWEGGWGQLKEDQMKKEKEKRCSFVLDQYQESQFSLIATASRPALLDDILHFLMKPNLDFNFTHEQTLLLNNYFKQMLRRHLFLLFWVFHKMPQEELLFSKKKGFNIWTMQILMKHSDIVIFKQGHQG